MIQGELVMVELDPNRIGEFQEILPSLQDRTKDAAAASFLFQLYIK